MPPHRPGERTHAAWRQLSLPLAAVLLLSGCGSSQSTLDPHSHAARTIVGVWWVMFVGAAVVFAVVVMLLATALVRGRAREEVTVGDPRRFGVLVLVGGFAVPLVVLVALFLITLGALPATGSPAKGSTSMTVQVTGKRWFWHFRYPASGAVTANELHIPVGTRVELVGSSSDVIHSFWVPALNRKIDLIPGHENQILLEADHPGTWRGQCAEFCGVQHAHMAFLVIAQPRATFEAWLRTQSRPAAPPAGDLAAQGAAAFAAAGCGGCHTIRGTPADGTVGPDLTHVGGRRMLAAGTVPNTRAWLVRWIENPQRIKPGNLMPGLDLPAAQVRAIAAYLAGMR
jgi:cytochrome c oxidase subunit 2